MLSPDAAIAAVIEVLDARSIESSHVEIDSRLEELGLDSLDHAELVLALEERLGFELDPQALDEVVTVGDLTRLRAQDEVGVA